ERLEHDQQGQRHVIGHLRRATGIRGTVGGDRLGQPGTEVLLAAPRARADGVQCGAGDDREQECPWIPDGLEVDPLPAQPGLLGHVLAVLDRAQHLVGGAEQGAAMLFEHLGVIIRACYGAGAAGHRALPGQVASTQGTSQSSLKPWLVRPSLPWLRVREFASELSAGSSLGWASLRCSRRLATIWSVPADGVAVAATEYSITDRSSGE